MEPGVMATQNFKRNLLLNFYSEGEKSNTCFLLPLKREIKKMSDICSLFPPFGDLAFLPVTLSSPWTVSRQAPMSLNFPGKNTRLGCHFLLMGIFQIQGSNSCLLHWHVDSLPLNHLGRKPLQVNKWE